MSTIGDISYRTKWLLSKRYIQAILVIALMTLAIAIPFFTRAFALFDVGNAGVFELDGNIVRNVNSTDWGDGPGGMGLFDSSGNTQSLPAGGLDAHWVNDGPHKLIDNTTFTTGSKDTLDIAGGGWQCTPSSNITPKDDILHSYSFAIIAQSGPRAGHLLVYAGFERFANNGAGDLGLWLLQDPSVGCSSTKGAVSFSGAHQVNDTLFVGEFSTGGTVTTLNAFRWVGITKATPDGVVNVTATGGADCRNTDVSANFCSRSNIVSISTPWSTQDKTSTTPNTLATAEFFEVGIDLTGLFGLNPPCINRFIFDTRTSPSLTATLMDYAEGKLVTCPKPLISTSVSPSPITFGSSANDTATVTLIPSGTVQGTVTFNAYASLSDCNAGTNSKFSDTESIGPAPSPASVTSKSFTPAAPGTYYWTAAYNPANPRNGSPVSTACGDPGETLVVLTIPKITAFGFTNVPTNGDPTTGSGSITYAVTIHNYATSTVTLSGTLVVSGPNGATVTCIGGNTLTLSGPLAGLSDATFNMSCTYSGTSGQTIQAVITANFTDQNGVPDAISGSPTTYTFTIQQK